MKSTKWRSLIVLGITLVSLWTTIPTLIYFNMPGNIRNNNEEFAKKVPSIFPEKHVKLGLDLMGGIQLKLGVDTKGSIESQLGQRAVDIERWSQSNKFAVEQAYVKKGSQRITLVLKKDYDDGFKAKLAAEFPSLKVMRVDGKTVYCGYSREEAKRIEASALQKALIVVQNRINGWGVAEPVVTPQADGSILVQLPGFTNAAKGADLLGKTAQLKFKIVDDEFKGFDDLQTDKFKGIRKIANTGLQTFFESEDRDQLRTFLAPHVPEDRELLFKKTELGDGTQEKYRWTSFVVFASTSLLGSDIKDAHFSAISSDQLNSAGPEVSLTMTGPGARRLREVSGKNIGKRMAIILDNVVETAPTLQSEIPNGQARITLGGRANTEETLEEGKELALILKSGSIPAEINILEQREVGASLGPELADKGIKGVLIGFALVILFMLLYYRKPGLIACFALLLNGLFLLAIMANFGFALTLPGIAGFILTLGMAVDANVLINERIRQEIKDGKNARNSIRMGFEKVKWTIIDANVTTLIAALVLIETSGPGPIKGFAITIMIGLLVSLFTSLYVSKVFFELATKNVPETKIKEWLLGGARDTHKVSKFNFLRLGTYATFVALGISLAVIMFASFSKNAVNYGVDFMGGTQITLHFEKDVETNLLRDQAEKAGIKDVKVQALDGGKRNFILRYDEDNGNVLEQHKELRAKGKEITAAEASEVFLAFKKSLIKDLAEYKPQVQQVEFIGPQVGKELRNQGILSVFYAILAVLLYIAFRFDMRFAPGAIVKMFLDIFILLGFYTFFGAPFDLVAVAAFLTVVGYSVNDTIVIYDRIRESLHESPGLSLRDNINNSLNETLPRTINTSLTTVASLVGILMLGKGDIWYFAMAMTLGVIIATLSSTFVASSFILWLEEWRSYRKTKDS